MNDHTQLALDLTQTIKPLANWNDYLQYGYYPYFLESKDVYVQKLTKTIQHIEYESGAGSGVHALSGGAGSIDVVAPG